MPYYMENIPAGPIPSQGPLGLGATNRPNYTLLSGGCYNTVSKRYVDDPHGEGARIFCAGDLEAKKKAETSAGQKFVAALPSIFGVISGGNSQPGPAPTNTTNKWLMPIAVGVVGIGVVLLINKKKAPKQNPTRRRRRRRR